RRSRLDALGFFGQPCLESWDVPCWHHHPDRLCNLDESHLIFSLITSLKKKPASIHREIPIPEEKEILITPVAVSVEATEFTEDTETPPDGFPLIESMVLSANDDYTLPPLELLKETSGVPGPPKEEITAAAS